MNDFDSSFFEAILNSMSHSLVFVDTDHVIRFANSAALIHYADRLEIGRSLLDCHNEASKRRILEIYATFEKGENECVYGESDSRRLIMFAVRNSAGKLIGYAERIEKLT